MGLAMKSSLLFMLPILVFIGLGNCGILGGEDKEKPIVWEEESLEGLVVYGFTAGDSVLHIVNLDNNTVTNIYGLGKLRSVASSNNRVNLFVSSGFGLLGGDPGYITMIDTKDWSHKVIFDHSSELLSGGDDIYFITKLNHLGYDITGNNEDVSHTRIFGKIDPITGQATIIDELDIYAFGLSDNNVVEIGSLKQELFGIDGDYKLFKYDIKSGVKELIFEEYDYLDHGTFDLSKDGNTLFFARGPVLDLKNREQIGFIDSFIASRLIARQDKREVYLSGPDDGGFYGSTLKKISIYSYNKNAIIGTIGVNSTTNAVYLSPKERYLITHNKKRILIVDLKLRELVKTIELSNEVSNFEKFYLFNQPITKGDTNEDIYIE